MPSFAVSICVLSLAQAGLVALPASREIPALARLRSGWWAALPAASVVGFVFGARAISGLSDGLTYLALIAVPPLAAGALGWAMRRSRPWLAPAALLLFALAWADRGGLVGETAGLALDALSCVTLAVALVAVSPRVLVKLGILAMSAVDVWLVVSDLLAAPNQALNMAAPVARLPQLQRVAFGSAVMGYGDLFVAALLGALLAAQARRAMRGAVIAALAGLAFDLLFLAVNELPATVPIAVTLVILEVGELRARRRSLRRAAGADRGVNEPA
ncbi:MAG: hypothetical protein ABR947_06875 [Solirubrobacteraceae bacterium]